METPDMMTVILEAINNSNNNINNNNQATSGHQWEVRVHTGRERSDSRRAAGQDRYKIPSINESTIKSNKSASASGKTWRAQCEDAWAHPECKNTWAHDAIGNASSCVLRAAVNYDRDDFEEQNKLRDKRKPAVNKHDTISSRETFAAINRPGNPVMKETFTRTTPDNKARLSSPLTLEKCLIFIRGMLDFQQKYNVEVRYTNYVDADLKYEIRARFELTDSNFYELSQQELHRCLSEMIAPMTKEEFLSMLKKAVHFSLPQNVGIFLNQILVYKEKLIRAIELLLLHAETDAALPACDSKPLGLLHLISEEVPF